jgi:hypothetical protein
VNTVVLVELARRADGKLYPAHPTSEAERDRLRTLVHALVCRDHLSIRAAQQTLRDSYGTRRSVGSIHRDLHQFECDHCAAQPARRPEPIPGPPRRPPEAPWHRGLLTDMITRPDDG